VELPHGPSAELKQTRDKSVKHARKKSVGGREKWYCISEEFEYGACK